MARILFITTANLSSNPRLLKEVRLALALKDDPEILAFRQGGWSDAMDDQIVEKLGVKVTHLSALRKPAIPWIRSSLVQEICRKIGRWNKKDLKITAYAVSKRSYLLVRYLKKIRGHHALVIGHNMGALYPAWWYAEQKNIPFAFDVEDYHPGEKIYKDAKNETVRRKILLEKILPDATYSSYASPLIREAISGGLKSDKVRLLINNCFPQNEFILNTEPTGKVKFIWFSQNISHSRGLELMIEAMKAFGDDLELHLTGNLDPNFHPEMANNLAFLKIHPPLPPVELNRSLGQYDVGLAIELNRSDYNRQICLTNKIWSYFQAGLYILATDTQAQQLFMKDHPGCGEICFQDVSGIRKSLKKIIQNISEIRKQKTRRFNNAQEYGWEKESIKLKTAWDQIFSR